VIAGENALCPDWITVSGGEFTMGGGPQANENPPHRVVLAPFRLAKTPVTRMLFDQFRAETGASAPSCYFDARFDDPRMPAVGVSWFQANELCAWVGARLDEPVRLPTEAEWECAARGGRDGVTYPFGEMPLRTFPDHETRWRDAPEPVDLYPSQHPWGFHGLGENVHEWCADWYDAGYYRSSPEHDPAGPTTGTRRASRGGSWRHAVKVTRCAARSSIPPDRQYADYGMRLAAGVPRA
jgi:sulfatase modifying factor 1